MIHFIVHDEGDSVGVVVVEGITAGQELSGWVMDQDKTVAAKALHVRSAVLLLVVGVEVRSYVWQTEDTTVVEMAGVLAHARSTHAYLAGLAPVPSSADEEEAAPTSIHGLPRATQKTVATTPGCEG